MFPATITRAQLTATVSLPDGSANTAVDFYISNNGGAQWFKVKSGKPFDFRVPGSDLRWRAELHSLSPVLSPRVLDVAIDVDTDEDGMLNASDPDDDDDGVPDTHDAFPLNWSENVDTDRDGVGDNADTDDDNDGVADGDDPFPLDPTRSATPADDCDFFVIPTKEGRAFVICL